MGKGPFSFVVVVLVSSCSKITIQSLNHKNRKKNKGDRAEYDEGEGGDEEGECYWGYSILFCQYLPLFFFYRRNIVFLILTHFL